MFKMNEDFNKKYGYKNHEREFAKKNWEIVNYHRYSYIFFS